MELDGANLMMISDVSFFSNILQYLDILRFRGELQRAQFQTSQQKEIKKIANLNFEEFL